MKDKISITVIQGSSRSHGETRWVSHYLESQYIVQFVDLKLKNIGQYDYGKINDTDDFLPTIKHIIETSDVLLFLSPIYWYTMSGILKTFLDRFTDLLKSEKPLGRQLRGKYLGYLTSSNDVNIDYEIDTPVRLSAGYLGMTYLGHCHIGVANDQLLSGSERVIDTFMDDCLSKIG